MARTRSTREISERRMGSSFSGRLIGAERRCRMRRKVFSLCFIAASRVATASSSIIYRPV